MTEYPKEAMTCGVCGEPMQRGHIWLNAFHPATLQWQSERPVFSAWRWFWTRSQGAMLLYSNLRTSPKTLRVAHRCLECHTLTIEHIDREISKVTDV